MNALQYFKWSFIVTGIGLALGLWLGWSLTGTVAGTLSVFFVVCVLVILEISLSFDNAIVNANKLKSMTPVWQRRFLTWGILIAVFGMRIVFPLAIVAIAARIGPFAALQLALAEPERYAAIMAEAHLGIAAFGGTFLMMVALSFFFDGDKDIHWVRWIESRVSRIASIRGVEIALVLALVMAFGAILPPDEHLTFVTAALWGRGGLRTDKSGLWHLDPKPLGFEAAVRRWVSCAGPSDIGRPRFGLAGVGAFRRISGRPGTPVA